MNGYGVVTDYWPRDSVPTATCQMHTDARLCAETGLLASAFCPNTQTAGIITLPVGHPLYRFIGTRYEDVLTQYLGRFVTMRPGVDSTETLLSTHLCSAHNYAADTGSQTVITDPVVRDQLLPDANALLNSARAQLAALPYDHWAYASLQNAINNLSSLTGGNPSASELMAAMALLTQAMASAR